MCGQKARVERMGSGSGWRCGSDKGIGLGTQGRDI